MLTFEARRCWLIAAFAVLTALTARTARSEAQSASVNRGTLPEGTPPALAPWVPWVRAQLPEAACPVRDGKALCFWPGALSLELRARDGSFQCQVQVDREQLVHLPGGSGRWPTKVRVNGKPSAVVASAGVPALLLGVGEHHIEGRFTWARLPEQLPVPPELGQLAVSIDGRPLVHPKRDDSGSLWLQRSAAESGAPRQAQLELTVARKLEDAVPLRVETRIRLRVSGDAREVNLGHVLLPGSVPLAIEAELPVRLSAQGELLLQVRPGSYSLRVLARVDGPVRELASGPRPEPWPAQEAWVFQPDNALRQVRITGAPAVDPSRLELDADLRGLPAFLVQATDKLAFEELRRGEPEPPPNQLALQRTLWLDQDGEGYTVRDLLSGELHAGFRLELREGQLGSLRSGSEDVVITQRTAAGALGVELREVPVAIQADSRLEDAFGTLPAVGWSEDVRQLGITLHLPPGYALWAVGGVDHVDRSWLGDWNLLGFFFVLVVAFGTAGIAGRWAGVIAFFAIGLTYQEADSPQAVWLWLLAAAALLRVLPAGRFWQLARIAFYGALLALALITLPFAARSVREAIYPQLAEQSYVADPSGVDFSSLGGAPAPRAAVVEEALEKSAADAPGEGASDRDDNEGGRGRRYRASDATAAVSVKKAADRDPEAIAQTGPGVPDWRFQSWRLSWSGPVAHDHHFQLYLVPPPLNRALALLRVLLCVMLAGWIVRAAAGFRPEHRRGPSAPPPTAAQIAGVLLVSLASGRASAQFPEPALLDQLRARATAAPACRPSCVSVAELVLEVTPEGLSLSAETHAQDWTSVRLPGPLALWMPTQVSLDGKPAHTLAHSDGFLHVRVSPGVQQLRASGPLPASDTFTLRLGDLPARVQVSTNGFEVSGVHADGTSEEAIELRKLLRETEPALVSLPPWFSVTRRFEIGNELRVHTTVTRETPLGTPQLVHLPLLASESVHDARVQVEGRTALLTFGPDDRQLDIDGTLTQSPQLALEATPHLLYAEQWQIDCGSMWACASSGLVPVAHEAAGRWLPQYRPWPGEKLQVALNKPTPAAGATTTIDAATLTVRPGVRATEAELQLSLRTSRGGDHQLFLPESARLRSLTVDGNRRSPQRDGAAFGFSVLPGHSTISASFELARGYETVLTVPQVALDARARNVRVVVEQPPERWLLWAVGPAWGPAILFWGYFLLALAVALLLGRTHATPLRTLDWLLLATGLTQIDSFAALCVVGFFFALAWRERTLTLAPLRHNVVQVALVFGAFAFTGALFDAVHSGLVVQPDMQVSGAGSHGNTLRWYVDESPEALPTPTLFSVPLWVYRVAMLLWSLWLARKIALWAPWAFRAFAAGGLWKKRPPKIRPPTAATAGAPPPPP
ncbi:MAG: hypothetical protein ABW321_15145 [Polyangiales bacterium]